jgi:hypothetical protein
MNLNHGDQLDTVVPDRHMCQPVRLMDDGMCCRTNAMQSASISSFTIPRRSTEDT